MSMYPPTKPMKENPKWVDEAGEEEDLKG